MLVAAEGPVTADVDSTELRKQQAVLGGPDGSVGLQDNLSGFAGEHDHPGAEVVHDGVAVSLNKNSVLVAARGDGADLQAILLATLEQSHHVVEPAVVKQHVILDEADVVVTLRSRFSARLFP